mmetsp:Transcript_61975/g.181133  ORF Transcript_61975/g.181133 Transcript_61975/m.181133 type:complete len:207 (+) Transcript_61975:2686-3306(+)
MEVFLRPGRQRLGADSSFGLLVEGRVHLRLPAGLLLLLPLLDLLPVLAVQAPLLVLAGLQHLLLPLRLLLLALVLALLGSSQGPLAARPQLRLRPRGAEAVPQAGPLLPEAEGDLVRADAAVGLRVLRVDLADQVSLEEVRVAVDLDVDIAESNVDVLCLHATHVKHKEDRVLILAPVKSDRQGHHKETMMIDYEGSSSKPILGPK